MKFREYLVNFMRGRYGCDNLENFLIFVYMVLVLFGMFVNSYVLEVFVFLLMVFIFYRFLSRNIYKRKRENDLYLRCKKRFLAPFSVFLRNFKDRDKVYKRCRNCKRVLKLPLPDKIGVKAVRCPSCHKKMKFLILRHQKIEIIKGSV